MKTTYLMTAVLLSLSSFISAQNNPAFQDTNGDGFYDIDEFSNVYSKGYNDWDIDRNGRIDNKEFFDNTYNQLDKNHDGRLTNEEWTAGYADYGDYVPAQDQAENPPQYISKTEFAKRFDNTDYFKSYDTNGDGSIDSQEMNGAAFNRVDLNHDGKLDEEELNSFKH